MTQNALGTRFRTDVIASRGSRTATPIGASELTCPFRAAKGVRPQSNVNATVIGRIFNPTKND
jgi:hypothetical protein